MGLTPQLLPAIVSINLSKGSQRMAASGVLVRRLESIANLGSMDVLCTDKTGTLTDGVATVTVALPYSPLSKLLGFVRLPPMTALALLGITALYVLGSELTKRVFYARVRR